MGVEGEGCFRWVEEATVGRVRAEASVEGLAIDGEIGGSAKWKTRLGWQVCKAFFLALLVRLL